ncbi:MAG: hypothetical protein GY851_12765, partial [bacterium]|nr:hypothetical protein [bacterium]
MSEPLLILILLTATIALSASPLASAQEIETAPESDWKAFMPDRGMISEQPADQWQDALVSGNGRMGAMVFGSPDERIILTHHRFNQPQSPDPVPVPDMAAYLPELRRLIRAGQYKEAATHWTNGMKAEGHPIALTKTEQREWPDIIWTDAVHPGYAIEAATSPKGAVRDYLRRTNFGTGEIGVQWTDDRGAWRSRLFVSRAADVVVYEIFPPRKGEVGFRLDEDLEGLDRRDRAA